MRKLVIVLTLLVVFLMPTLAMAQANVHLSSVSVDIWPEYDQPAVLVIYHSTLAQDTVLPARLTLKIPAAAQVNAVAIIDPAGGLINAPYEQAVQGTWTVLTITVNSLEVQVEYYDALVKDNQTRHIVFEWSGDAAVDTLEINFLRPGGAQDLAIVPAAVLTGFGQVGLANYRLQTTNLAAGQSFIVAIDYLRNTDELGIAGLPVQAASTPGPDTPGRVSMTGILPWILAAIGVLLIAAGVVAFIVWQRGDRIPAQERSARDRELKQAEVVYCRECGKRAQPGDTFCRTCGARLRR